MRTDWDDDLSILSAENVHFGVETAGLGSRLAAVTIDFTIQLIVMLVFAIGLNYLQSLVPDLSVFSRGMRSAIVAVLGLIVFLILYGYYFLFEWLWDGQTPGKRWLGLRVLQTSGMPVTLWPAMVRNLLRIVDFLPAFYGVGALVAILNEQNRRAGDLVAGTLVARERRESAKQVLDIGDAVEIFLASVGAAPSAATSPAATSAAPAQLLVPSIIQHSPVDPEVAALRSRLNEQDYELARDFLQRRDSLPPATRERLGLTVAARLAIKLNEPQPTEIRQAEVLLESIAAIWQRGLHNE